MSQIPPKKEQLMVSFGKLKYPEENNQQLEFFFICNTASGHWMKWEARRNAVTQCNC